ncbi:MAG: hypothetical protein JOZ69_06340, partial [Myxococcales bacterium]|nr:hypothetical protein [Myxococcales bacterium]
MNRSQAIGNHASDPSPYSVFTEGRAGSFHPPCEGDMPGRGTGKRLRDIQRPLERAIAQGAPIFLATIAVVLIVGGVFDFVTFTGAAGRWIVVGDLGTALVCAGLSLSWQRWPWLQRGSDPVFFLVGTLLAT